MQVPTFGCFLVEGSGNPNSPEFADYIQVLYALSYGVKMAPKSGTAPAGYVDYRLYPLEGVWTLTEEGIAAYEGRLNKDHLAFRLSIRQPDFVTPAYAAEVIESVKKKKKLPLLDSARFDLVEDGTCVQMLHLGSYDNEPASFEKMEAYCAAHGLVRRDKTHREIYLSDARKTAPEKLRTILRIWVRKEEA